LATRWGASYLMELRAVSPQLCRRVKPFQQATQSPQMT
jgi:hypothetical protein